MNILNDDAKTRRLACSPLLTLVAATALTSVVGLAGCGVDAGVDAPVPDESSTQPAERDVAGETLELSEQVYFVGADRQHLRPDGSRIIVDADAPDALADRGEGDILVFGDFVQGRWRLIESVSEDADGQTVWHTRQALLTEVVRSGSIGVVLEAGDGGYQARLDGVSSLRTPRRTLALTATQALEATQTGSTVSGAGSLSIEADLAEWERAQIDTAALALTTTGHLKSEPTIKIALELDNSEIVETETWVAGDVDLDVDMLLELHPDDPGGPVAPTEINRSVDLCVTGDSDCAFSVDMLGSRFTVRPQARISYRYFGDGKGVLQTGYQTGDAHYLKAGFRHSDEGFEVIRDFEGFDVTTEPIGSRFQENDFTLQFEAQLDLSYQASLEPLDTQPWWEHQGSSVINQPLSQSTVLPGVSLANFEVTPYSGFFTLGGAVNPPACGLEKSLTLRGQAVRKDQTHPLYERALFEQVDNLIQTDQRVWDSSMVTPSCDPMQWCIAESNDPMSSAVCSRWYPDVNTDNFASLALINCQVDQCDYLTPSSRSAEVCEACQSRLCDNVEVTGVAGCELQPELCDSDSDCAEWEMCAFNKQCIRDTPVRVTVSWAAPVDLELYAFDQDGFELHELTGAAYDDAPDGWIAARSEGDSTEGAPYFEAAVYAFVDQNEPLRFFVENKTHIDDDGEIAYTLRIDHAATTGFDGFTRQYEGKLVDIAGASSLGYAYYSEVDVEHCYKIDPETDTQDVCISGATSGASLNSNWGN